MSTCVNCILKCFKSYLNYLNSIAYANMAISGDKYCTSAFNGFILNLKHMGLFLRAQVIGRFLVSLGIFTVSALSTLVFFVFTLILNKQEE